MRVGENIGEQGVTAMASRAATASQPVPDGLDNPDEFD